MYYYNCNIKGSFYFLVCTNEALVFVGSENGSFDEVIRFVGDNNLQKNYNEIKKYKDELEEYFSGNKKKFDFEIKVQGTEFQKKVWSELQNINYGSTVTYSFIAEKIGKPKAVRAVASAIGKNPLLVIVPCHRVVGKNGKLSGYRGGLEMKRKLLKLEQVEI